MPFWTQLLLFLGLAQVSLTLEVTPGSACASLCLDDGESDSFDSDASTTNITDITCKDPNFSQIETGIRFQNCQDCLQNSEVFDGEESDAKWFIHNTRYTLSTCLFSNPQKPLEEDLDSPCALNGACRGFELALGTGGLAPDAGSIWEYCDAEGDLFTSEGIWSCVKCLRISEEQKYLANFMVALEAGCEQRPKDGETLGLSGTVFTTGGVNITGPVEDILDRPEGAGSSSMTTGTIVGIAVGVGLFLLGGVALFFVHRRRQKSQENFDARFPLGSASATPDPFLPPEGGMSQSINSYSHSRGPSGQGNSGEYFDRMDEEIRAGRVNYAFDPRVNGRGPGNLIPTHSAYDPRTMSKTESTFHSRQVSAPPAASQPPPATVHRHTKSNAPDSFALQSYGKATQDPGLAVTIDVLPPPPAGRPSGAPDRQPIATLAKIPPPPPRQAPKVQIPSLSLPSIPKLRMSKKYTPPTLTVQEATPIEATGIDICFSPSGPVMHISDPVMSNKDARFQDKPLGGKSIISNKQPLSHSILGEPDYEEVRSGKSTLYGY